MEMNMGRGSLCKDLDQGNIPISHVEGEITKCLYDKIIAAWAEWLSLKSKHKCT